MHAAADFSLYTVTASAERVDVSTPGGRVTWNTTVPPECMCGNLSWCNLELQAVGAL